MAAVALVVASVDEPGVALTAGEDFEFANPVPDRCMVQVISSV